MAIAAVQLHETVGAFQIMAQMNCMVQLDGSGVRAAGSHGGELGMSAVKASNVMREVRRWPIAAQVCVALRAGGVCSGGEAQMASMLLMARRTIRLEGLIRVVNRAVVA
jgi:hypothetical protein